VPSSVSTPKHSIGGTLHISYSKDAEIYAGPKLRYRYWLNPTLSLEVGAGGIAGVRFLISKAGLSIDYLAAFRYIGLEPVFARVDNPISVHISD